MIIDCCDTWAQAIDARRMIRLWMLEHPDSLTHARDEAHLETLGRAEENCQLVAMSWVAANDERQVA